MKLREVITPFGRSRKLMYNGFSCLRKQIIQHEHLSLNFSLTSFNFSNFPN